MNTLFKIIFATALLSLAACESPESAALKLPPSGFELEKISNESFKGRIQGADWKMQTAIGSLTREGELQVLISGNGEVLNCNNQYFRKVGVAFVVPFHLGNYAFDMLKPNSGNPVTLTFPPHTGTPDYMTVIADKSQITIDSINNGIVKGGLSAKVLDPSYPANLNGRFEVTMCY